MTEKELKTIQGMIETTVKATLKEIRKGKENYCHQNTVLLLRNYDRLKDHVDYAISNPGDVKTVDQKICEMEMEFYSDYDEDFLNAKPDIFIESILASKVRTALMVAHIDAMVKQLHAVCKADGGKEYDKFLIFHDMYFGKLTCEDIAEKMDYSVSQVYRIAGEMVERLSVLLWGISGLRGLI